MKFRNVWKIANKQLDKFIIRLKISAIEFLGIELDFTRDFYSLTILNFTIKNR